MDSYENKASVPSRTPPALWVAAPGRLRGLRKKLASVARAEWCYLGSDLSGSERAAEGLSGARRVFIGDELKTVAHDLRQPFIDWIAAIGERQKHRVNWWASRLASKSPLQTDLFVLVCYSRLIDGWLDRPSAEPVRIAAVEDPWLRWVLRRRFAGDGRIRFHGGWLAGCLGRAVYWLLRIPAAMGWTALSSVWASVRSRLLFRRETENLAGPQTPAILLYTWIEQKSFSVPGNIRDAHTGRLEEILLDRGESILRLTPLEIEGRLLRRLKEFSARLVLAPRYLRIFDILVSLCSWFRITDLAKLAQFRGCDYRPLFYRELLLERGSTSFPRYRLWHRAMLRIAADLGPKVKCLIYPFENQPWEKLLCLAWRRRAPHVQLIGYQHSRVPPLLLSYALSGNEVEMTPLPDRIVANGEATLQSLRAAGFPDSKLANGGALRYEYLYSGNGNGAGHAPAPGNGRTSERKSVLVAFPLSPPHCKGLLADLLDEFKTPLFAHDGDRVPIQLVLKCHPWLPLKRFHRGKAILPEWAGFTEEPIEQELARADLLLYVPSTTIWREAYLAGVPVLKYEVDLLDLDPPDSLNGFSVHPCSKETLRSLIRQLLAKPPAKKPPPEVLAKTFGRVNEQFWATIVQAGAGSEE